MTTMDEHIALKLTGRIGLLAAVPALLGFHPEESLVMMCMSGPRRRVGPVIRVDAQDDDSLRMSATLIAHADRFADEVALALYTETPGPPELLHLTLAGLAAAGVPVLDALVVRNGRAWPVEPDSDAYPGRGQDMESLVVPDDGDPQVQAVSAAVALRGRGILPDRDALARSIAGPTGAAAGAAAAAFHQAADRLLSLLESERMTDPDPVVHRAQQIAELAIHLVTEKNQLNTGLAAELALLVSDVAARDAVVGRAVAEVDVAWLPMLICAAGQVLDRDAAGLTCLLAMVAYRHGDGALAQVALDRCLTAEPDYRLAHLLLAAMGAGLPPEKLAEIVGSAVAESATGKYSKVSRLRPGRFRSRLNPGTAR